MELIVAYLIFFLFSFNVNINKIFYDYFLLYILLLYFPINKKVYIVKYKNKDYRLGPSILGQPKRKISNLYIHCHVIKGENFIDCVL